MPILFNSMQTSPVYDTLWLFVHNWILKIVFTPNKRRQRQYRDTVSDLFPMQMNLFQDVCKNEHVHLNVETRKTMAGRVMQIEKWNLIFGNTRSTLRLKVYSRPWWQLRKLSSQGRFGSFNYIVLSSSADGVCPFICIFYIFRRRQWLLVNVFFKGRGSKFIVGFGNSEKNKPLVAQSWLSF